MLTHGQCCRGKKTREWMTWNGMIGRCTTPSAHRYDRYGGRGIRVCDRWRHSFENFLADMGPKPTPAHSIERLDSNGDYCPDNCKWATKREQTRNTSRNFFVEYRGEVMCLTDLATKTGVLPNTLKYRLKKGMGIEEAVSKPINYPKTRKRRE